MTLLTRERIDTQATDAFSERAVRINDESHDIRSRLQESCTMGLIGRGVINELDQVYDECRTPNWDGYGAFPVLKQTYDRTREFLELLPLGITPPSIGAEPDGQLTLEWHANPYRTLSVSIAPDGYIHYSALMGRRRRFGTERIGHAASAIVSDLVREIVPDSA